LGELCAIFEDVICGMLFGLKPRVVVICFSHSFIYVQGPVRLPSMGRGLQRCLWRRITWFLPPLLSSSQVKFGFLFVVGVVQLHLYVLGIYSDSLSSKQGA
jgi:hypothetical protein